jgi:hypothetical protein
VEAHAAAGGEGGAAGMTEWLVLVTALIGLIWAFVQAPRL